MIQSKCKANLTLYRGYHLKNIIEQIRKQQNMTQVQLASALGVTRQTISSLEQGRYNPSIILAFKISKFFNLPIDEIFIYEEDNDEK